MPSIPRRFLLQTPVLHWHGDQFEIPEGASRLAETPGFPNQAFAIGKQILGLQFHLETEHTQIERWLIGHAHELAAHRLDPRLLRHEAGKFGARLAQVARQVFGAWLDQL
jgi:GMP synthase (glutamine-hydrolysing)